MAMEVIIIDDGAKTDSDGAEIDTGRRSSGAGSTGSCFGEAGQGRGRGQEGQKSGKGKGRGPRHQKGPRMRQRERPRRTRQRESPRQRWITGDEPVTDSWSEFVVEEDHLNSMKPFIGAYVPSNTTKHQQS